MAITNKYSVNDYAIETVLNWYRSDEIAIPEIQRPFIWPSQKVTKLLDSLYRGYPVGYLIVWKNPNVKLKDGTSSEGKKILIDGQQRILALITSIESKEIVDKNYEKTRIAIAFNPIKEEFKSSNPAIRKDVTWIQDISPIIKGESRITDEIKAYCKKNPSVDRGKVEDSIENLKKIMNRPVGLIELEHDLDIEIVTEIFIRINSEGIPLNQADFAMSKIASNESYNGTILRKTIDYFCHLMKAPEFYDKIKTIDKDFSSTPFFQKISWLKNENDELYEPNYSDMLRVAFTSEFYRGKLADLVSLLSGRNFETRKFEEKIAEESFSKLEEGILKFVNETNFKRFLMILKSAGFISPDLIRSKNAINFAYILYLTLKNQGYKYSEIERYIKKWFVLSILTKRYSASPESQFDFDIRTISKRNQDFENILNEVESGDLSDAFWDVTLLQNLETPVASSPYFKIFLAAQVKLNDNGFLSRDIKVRDMISQRGDIHHVFPREYLKKEGFTRSEYNQIANYAYTQSEINIKIGKKSPKQYFSEIQKQCNGGELMYGGICDMKSLEKNLEANAIPTEVFNMEYDEYENFLELRRIMMRDKIKEYYNLL